MLVVSQSISLQNFQFKNYIVHFEYVWKNVRKNKELWFIVTIVGNLHVTTFKKQFSIAQQMEIIQRKQWN